MPKRFEQRNQTDTARRKLKSLAEASGVDVVFASALANFTWDYDPRPNDDEAEGWVNNKTISKAAKEQLNWIAEKLGMHPDVQIERDQAAKELLQVHGDLVSATVWGNFVEAASTKNYWRVSEFASYHHLRGINDSRVRSLEWRGRGLGLIEIVRNLFLKLFRGGSIERNDLGYLWCDLAIPLSDIDRKPLTAAPWLESLLASIETLPPNSGLKDLLACCKGLVGGDKFFKQEVLQALAYADVLRVNQLPVTEVFLPERRNKLSPHFYSNEWSFPLRFWSTNGGSVNRAAIPTH